MRELRLAETIAALRKKQEVTQEEMGKTLGITPQAISKWENGTCLPDTQTLPLIDAHLVNEKVSKHRSLGKTYEIDGFYHTCLCILLATLEMQRLILQGRYRCCAGYGDFPIDLKKRIHET